MRYVAKPVEIDAVHWTGDIDDLPAEWRASGMFHIDEIGLVVRTNKGVARARLSDFIVRGTAGEYYPVPAAIFTYKYEPVGGAS